MKKDKKKPVEKKSGLKERMGFNAKPIITSPKKKNGDKK